LSKRVVFLYVGYCNFRLVTLSFKGCSFLVDDSGGYPVLTTFSFKNTLSFAFCRSCCDLTSSRKLSWALPKAPLGCIYYIISCEEIRSADIRPTTPIVAIIRYTQGGKLSGYAFLRLDKKKKTKLLNKKVIHFCTIPVHHLCSVVIMDLHRSYKASLI